MPYPGITTKTLENGVNNIYVRFKHLGKVYPVKNFTKLFGCKTEKQAYDKLQEVKLEISKGTSDELYKFNFRGNKSMKKRDDIVQERFELKESYCKKLQEKIPHFGFGGFGEATYYRTYSRIKDDGSQEHWADTVIRVINGIMSVRKNHSVLNRLEWIEETRQQYAYKLAQ
ncbi:MAG: hypothetical protein U9R50_09505, partial [Campylobacterota bacterium]|nr:hypothetical protein [Campylobacterota bacterium]